MKNFIFAIFFILSSNAMAAEKPAVEKRMKMESHGTPMTATYAIGMSSNAGTKPAVAARMAMEVRKRN